MCLLSNSYADNKDIINVLFIAKENISVVSDSDSLDGVNNKIYKGTYFVIKKEENVSRRDNGRVLLHDVKSYPYRNRINGWLNIDELMTTTDAKKVSSWPFKAWKVDMRSVMNRVYEFDLDGGVEFYNISEEDNDIQKRSGHVYLVDDIAIVKYQISGYERYLPFAIYDKSNARLCPLGKDISKCDDYLTSKETYRDFYLEKY